MSVLTRALNATFDAIADAWPDERTFRRNDETQSEALTRVSARRSTRIKKAVVYGALATGMIGVPVVDLSTGALESISNGLYSLSKIGEPKDKDSQAVPQYYAAKPGSDFDGIKHLGEGMLMTLGLAFGVAAGRKAYLAKADKKKINAIEEGIRWSRDYYGEIPQSEKSPR